MNKKIKGIGRRENLEELKSDPIRKTIRVIKGEILRSPIQTCFKVVHYNAHRIYNSGSGFGLNDSFGPEFFVKEWPAFLPVWYPKQGLKSDRMKLQFVHP
jgi:hypothetical protein